MWLSIGAVIGSVLVGIPSSAVASPGAESTVVDESPTLGTESALAAFLQNLASSGKSKSNSNQSEASTNRRINLDAILGHLPDDARFRVADRQKLFADLASKGVSFEASSRLTNRHKGKSISGSQLQRGRIINGIQTPISEAPWQVGLVRSPSNWAYNSKSDYYNFVCGGSIIGSRWILTAAHCVEWFAPKEISVIFGRENILINGLVPRSNKASVRQIIIHPAYEFGTGYKANDIALIELSTNLKFSPGKVEAIRLATPESSRAESSELFVSGWGATSKDEDGYPLYPEQLQSGTTLEVDCPESYMGSGRQDIICAGSPDNDPFPVDACYGDSGGPLVYSKSNVTQRELVGVVSFGPECPPAGIGAYANVAYFSSWIMCHASVHIPVGGPYFCGDEAGFVTVADTLKVRGGVSTRTSIQWMQGEFGSAVTAPIRGANKTSLSMKGLFGKVISVRVTSGSLSPTVHVFNNGETVTEAFQFDYYPSGDFTPCVSLNIFPPNKGKCVGKRGQYNGELFSEAGKQIFDYDENGYPIGLEYGYWGYKDFTLPKNTVGWTWGLAYPWSPGIVVSPSFEYGAGYFGVTASATPLNSSTWDRITEFPVSQYPRGYGADGKVDFELNPLGGPLGEDWDNELLEWSQLMVKGKGRILLGTLGDEELGSRLSFDGILVFSMYR